MFRRFSVDFAIFSIVLDAALVAAALVAAGAVRPLLSHLPFAQDILGPIPIPGAVLALASFGWVLAFLLASVYDAKRNLRAIDELGSITLGSLLASVLLAGALYLTYRGMSRVLFLVFALFAYLLTAGWRMIYRLAAGLGSVPVQPSRRVLIVGAGPVGKEMQGHVLRHERLGMGFVGFLDDDPSKHASEGKSILGSLADVRSAVTEQRVTDVVLALPARAYQQVNRLVAELHDLPVRVWVIPDYFHLALHRAVMEEFAGIPLLDLRAPALSDYQRMLKRMFDLALTVLTLPFALVIMGLISIVIRLDSPGPVIFRQQRVGENGRLFEMYKFRTMVENAEQLRPLVERVGENGVLIHKTANDPRVTKVGRFLRRTSLDELPQVFNVLRGEMSLVGPRPEVPYMVDKYELWQRKRFSVPQGMTGWWQINGRSDKLMHLHTEDDLYYVQNYSIWLDIVILLRTIGAAVSGRGAF